MKTRYKQRKDREGFTHEAGKVWKLACCDCGLVHRIVIIPDGKLLGIAAERDNRATAQRRRQMKKRGETINPTIAPNGPLPNPPK